MPERELASADVISFNPPPTLGMRDLVGLGGCDWIRCQ